MNFDTAAAIESVTWYMRLSDYPRATNRALINDLFNGVPPYTDDEVAQNNISTNVNFLEPTKVAMDARRQFYTALSNPSPLFRVGLDVGPKHKRGPWAAEITKHINKIIKRSAAYMELQRSQFALDVMHGIGPCSWTDQFRWCPIPLGVEDVMIPTSTTLDMANLPFLAVYRRYTAMQLTKAISGPRVDPGWNIPVVKACLQWADEQASRLMQASWPEVWSPEKMNERRKENSGLTGSDSVPTIDCWDFYFWDDQDKEQGWKRRIVLDTWSSTNIGGQPEPVHKVKDARNQFLYTSRDNFVASKLSSLAHWQFADASSVAPFRYHSVRSLGFLLYSVCHLQNRLRCKFSDATFETLLQYFRTGSPDEAERVAKVVLTDKAVIPDGVQFVPADQRWQVNDQLVMSCLGMNRQSISDSSSSFTQDYQVQDQSSRETATQVMAKVNSSSSLINGMLSQAYDYQNFQYCEIARRFCIKNSPDPDVRSFRVECLKEGVSEEALNHMAWDIQATRTIGGGNRMQQVAVADKLMSIRSVLDPDSQRQVDRIFISANTEDYDLAETLVPERPEISDARHDGQLAAAALFNGMPVDPAKGINHIDYIEALISSAAAKVQQIEAVTQGNATMEQIIGFTALLQHAAQQIALLAQDKAEQQRARGYMENVKEITNAVRAYKQRLKQAKQQAGAQAGAGGPDPKDAAKAQAMVIQAQTKAKLSAQTHAEKTAQRQISWQADEKRKQQQHQLDLQRQIADAAIKDKNEAQTHALSLEKALNELKASIAAKDLETAAKVRRMKLEAKKTSTKKKA